MGAATFSHSFKVLTTLSAQRVVAADTSAANTVTYPGSAQHLPLGITLNTVRDTTGAIPVACAGQIAELYFNDTVATGNLVASDTSGRGIPFTLANTTTALTLASAYVGVLIGPTVAATATISDVYICPGFDRE